MSKVVRKLDEHEVALLEPELREYAKGQAALHRLQRMIALLASELQIEGLELDLDTMELVRPDE